MCTFNNARVLRNKAGLLANNLRLLRDKGEVFGSERSVFLPKMGGGGGRISLWGLKINPKSPCKMYK